VKHFKRDFERAWKIEDSTKFKNFFAQMLQIKSRFVLAKKNLGVRCTLTNVYKEKPMVYDKTMQSGKEFMLS